MPRSMTTALVDLRVLSGSTICFISGFQIFPPFGQNGSSPWVDKGCVLVGILGGFVPFCTFWCGFAHQRHIKYGGLPLFNNNYYYATMRLLEIPCISYEIPMKMLVCLCG